MMKITDRHSPHGMRTACHGQAWKGRLFKAAFAVLCVLCVAGLPDASAKNTKWAFFSRQETKKEMKAMIDSLRGRIDSLQSIIDGGAIEIVDTSGVYDTINVGSISILESEGYYSIPDNAPTDSLLHTWYMQKSLSFSNAYDISDIDSVYFESDVPDSVYIERLEKMNSFIQLPYNNIVRNHIIYYTQKIPNTMSEVLGLCQYYMPIFEEVMDMYDLPKELKAMAVIESSLNPVAVSRARAKGMWQFMYTTAKQYGLEISSYVDERFDPVKSAHAAAKYLKDSYAIFGDWNLAIASYNCGAGNVNKAIRRAGSREFWDIYQFLPRETRGYVPAFVAALYAMTYYKEHRIVPKPCNMPAHVDTFMVRKMLHFDQISEVIGIDKSLIKSLNSQYLHEIIPGVEHPYVLRLPYEYTVSFIENEDSIYAYKDNVYFSPVNVEKIKRGVSMSSSRVVHTVRSGETLGGIAIRYRVRVSDIQGWNNLRGTMIRKGQRLVIYAGGSYSAPKATSASGNRIIHVVKSGETLGGIAEKYGTRAANIRKWNNIRGDMIRVGQKLTIYSKNAAPETTVQNGYVMYTVKSGDSLWEIAKKFPGTSLDQIMKLNGLDKNSKIYPGKKIKIKKK